MHCRLNCLLGFHFFSFSLLGSIFAIALILCEEISERKYLSQLCNNWYNYLLHKP